MLLGETTSGLVVAFMFVLAALLTRHYLVKRHIYTLWWSVAFWFAFLAAIMDFSSYLFHGWNVGQYRLYLWSAATLVAYMGAGTVYLFSRKLGHAYIVVMSLIAVAMLVTLMGTQFPLIDRMPPGEEAQGFVPASIAPYFGLLSGIGATALFIGALYSYWKTRLPFNLWIALGALVFSIGGAVGSMVNVYQLFYVFQAIGSVILYYGIVRSFKRPFTAPAPRTRTI